MRKRSSTHQGPLDANEIAFRVVSEAVGDAKPDEMKNPTAAALGRLGGIKGGKARAAKLTPEQRSEMASIAANARWKRSGN